MRVTVAVLIVAAVALSVAGKSKADQAKKGDLVLCDACVAVTTEMCDAALKHNKVLGEDSDKRNNKVPSGGRKMTPMSVVMAETMADACHIDRLRKYSHPPPVLTPKCHAFLAKHEDDVEEFFQTFHRKEESERKCRVAVDILCNDVTGVCLDFDHENIDRGGVQTYEFREKGTKPDKGGMKTWGGPGQPGGGKIPDGLKNFKGGKPPEGKQGFKPTSSSKKPVSDKKGKKTAGTDEL